MGAGPGGGWAAGAVEVEAEGPGVEAGWAGGVLLLQAGARAAWLAGVVCAAGPSCSWSTSELSEQARISCGRARL